MRLEPVEPGAMTFEFDADVVEPLGSLMDLHGQIGDGVTIVARCPAEHVDPGQKLRFRLDSRRVHLFEPGETGRNLSLSK